MRWLVFVASLLVLAIMGAFVFKKCADNPFCLSEVEVASQRAPELMGGLSFFDTRMLRVLTTMLREFYLKTPAQFLQFNTWFPAGFGLMTLIHIEFERQSMWGVWLLFALYQFGSFCIFAPLAFSVYIFTSRAQPIPKLGLTQPRVIVAMVQLLCLFVPMIALNGIDLKAHPQAFDTVMAFMLMVPVLIPVASRFLLKPVSQATSYETKDARVWITACLGLIGGAGFALYWMSVVKFLADYQGIPRSWNVFATLMASNEVQELLANDMLISLSSFYVFILYDSGFKALIQAAILSPLLSPAGAFALWFWRRERHNRKSIRHTSPVKSSKYL